MHSVSRFRVFSALLLCLLMLASACATRGEYDELEKYKPDEEELVDNSYTPRDDGKALSSAEERAFRSLGQIDRELSQEETAVVELHFKYFVHERRNTFERFLGRTARYLPTMEQALRERGIPEEVVALAMAESGGNPNAISPAGAAGLWQFMPFTGRKYGLTVNTWIDERRDPYKATYAAADYLLKLYGDFKDWKLAIAAYNAGEGKIGRAVEQSGSRNFFDICRLGPNLDTKARLKQETMDYVPRVIAMSKIMRNLKRLGFHPPTGMDAFKLNPVTLPPGTNLSALARSIGLTWDEFQSMNPAFRRTASPPNAETTAYVPPEKLAEATSWVQKSPDSHTFADWKEHTVRKGESVASIAKKYRISTKALTDANGFTKLPRAGTVILIPAKGGAVEPVMSAMAEKSSRAQHPTGKYTVKSGDTLFSLAHQWGTSVESIREANRLGKSNSLHIGQRLSVPGDSAKTPPKEVRGGSPAAQSRTGSYTVKSGDTLGGIAESTGVPTRTLCYLNDLTPKSTLRIGQKLLLAEDDGAAEATVTPAKVTSPAKTAKTSEKAVVAQKDTTPAKDAVAPKQDNATTLKKEEAVSPKAEEAKKPEPAQKAVATKDAVQKAPQKGATITVAPGDTLYSLARKHGTSVDKIVKANGLGKKPIIRPGQKLKLP